MRQGPVSGGKVNSSTTGFELVRESDGRGQVSCVLRLCHLSSFADDSLRLCDFSLVSIYQSQNRLAPFFHVVYSIDDRIGFGEPQIAHKFCDGLTGVCKYITRELLFSLERLLRPKEQC